MTLAQVYLSEYQKVQCAFKNSMIHVCNSHYLSRFAAFFIDARTKRSVVETFDFLFFRQNVIKWFLLLAAAKQSVTISQTAKQLQIHRCNMNLNNDPSAGSPTETLLRLVLPLNDQVCPASATSLRLPTSDFASGGLTKPFNR